ncbi:hypothetical protein JD844_016100 [Phrynosoma platyrhinos]|uniref:XK-related protein n=1 Tax=Phrynosoma platyrhinos TaxID=52577 RepID=A0ABQ7SK06_PHRPL|nr:hypothetical protein JD844_016100 [Phrynosoma platyrhinos]
METRAQAHISSHFTAAAGSPTTSLYWFALKHGYQAAFKPKNSRDLSIAGRIGLLHKRAIDAMADISMLRLFKTYLESTPQLILQIYILMASDNRIFSQYVSISVSFISISCATVDYQIALRKSLLDKNKFVRTSSKIMTTMQIKSLCLL